MVIATSAPAAACGGRSDDPDAAGLRRSASGGHEVEALHLMTGLHEIAGHGPAHVAEADEARSFWS